MEQEKQPLKVYYTIGEVADMFGVNTSLIRFWEKEFDIIKPHKNKKGNRQFTKADIDNFHLIYHLVKEKKMTLRGAQMKLRENKTDTEVNFEVVKRLKINQTRVALHKRTALLTSIPETGPETHDNN